VLDDARGNRAEQRPRHEVLAAPADDHEVRVRRVRDLEQLLCRIAHACDDDDVGQGRPGRDRRLGGGEKFRRVGGRLEERFGRRAGRVDLRRACDDDDGVSLSSLFRRAKQRPLRRLRAVVTDDDPAPFVPRLRGKRICDDASAAALRGAPKDRSSE